MRPHEGESLGVRIRRLRRERGVSLAKIGGGDFTRAFLSQVELGRAQPSLRVLRVIADRLGTHVDYLLEGRSPEVDRELALERARVLLLRGEPKRALISLRGLDEAAWPIGTDARLTEAEALAQLGRTAEAVNAAEVLLSNYPGLTVNRHLRNFHWKRPEDLAHYRDGLLNAGVPLAKLTLVQSDLKRVAES